MTVEHACSIGRDGDTVSRYVAGTLEADELRSFEVHLLGCPECQEAVREGTALAAALRTGGNGIGRGGRKGRLLKIAVPALAAAAVAVWLLLPGGEPFAALGAVEAAPPFDGLPVRSAPGLGADLVARGMAAYRDGEFGTAARLLDRAEDPDPGVRFFLGISLLMTGESERAAEALREAAEPRGNPYAPEAHLYRAKAWLRLGRADSALAQLAAASGTDTGTPDVRSHAAALADSVREVLRRETPP